MSKIYKTKNENPKIALIGATGKAGKYILTKLLERNYQVKLLLRNPENFQIQNPLIKIIKRRRKRL
jgi:putative NADH-flavin reductase